jgi:5-methylcytosine-specific restriction protein A
MSLGDESSQTPVLQAIAEFERLGRDGFLEKDGFGNARDYFVEYKRYRYDSKAIVGVAYGYAVPGEGPLRSEDSPFPLRSP